MSCVFSHISHCKTIHCEIISRITSSKVSLISWASLVLGTISPDEALESVKVPSTVSPQSSTKSSTTHGAVSTVIWESHPLYPDSVERGIHQNPWGVLSKCVFQASIIGVTGNVKTCDSNISHFLVAYLICNHWVKALRACLYIL